MAQSRRSIVGLLAVVLLVSLASQWWGRHLEQSLARDLARLAGPGDILMIASDTCPYCDAARHFMKEAGVSFTECSIERDAQCLQKFQGSLMQGTPVVVVRGQMQQGFNAQRVLDRLAQRAG